MLEESLGVHVDCDAVRFVISGNEAHLAGKLFFNHGDLQAAGLESAQILNEYARRGERIVERDLFVILKPQFGHVRDAIEHAAAQTPATYVAR